MRSGRKRPNEANERVCTMRLGRIGNGGVKSLRKKRRKWLEKLEDIAHRANEIEKLRELQSWEVMRLEACAATVNEHVAMLDEVIQRRISRAR